MPSLSVLLPISRTHHNRQQGPDDPASGLRKDAAGLMGEAFSRLSPDLCPDLFSFPLTGLFACLSQRRGWAASCRQHASHQEKGHPHTPNANAAQTPLWGARPVLG